MKKSDIYPILFVLASAIATVSIDDLVAGIPAKLVLFIVTSIAIIYFHLINAKNILKIYHSAMKNPFLLIAVNVLLAATWLATYLGIYYLGASVYNIFYFSISAALAASITTLEVKKSHSITLLMCLILVLAWYLMNLPSTGVIFSVIGGVSGFLYRHYSYKLSSNNNLSSSQILAIRFWLLWLVLFYLAPLDQTSKYMSLYYVFLILIVAFISFILQNWLNQQGIIKAGVKRSTTILAFTPLATIACQYVFLRQYSLNWILLSIVCLLIIFSKNIKLSQLIAKMRLLVKLKG